MPVSRKSTRTPRVPVNNRARAVLCLLLLLFSIGHTVYGHGDLQLTPTPAHGMQGDRIAAAAQDTPDACALCVAMATAVPMHGPTLQIPVTAQPRPPAEVLPGEAIHEWHPSLLSRPPPAALLG
jgi:hypothetical protein